MNKIAYRRVLILLFILTLIISTSIADAGLNGQSVDPGDYEGSRSTNSGGIDDNWNGNFNIVWDVSFNDISGIWSYEYTLFDGHDIWDMILEMPGTATSGDISNVIINGSTGAVTGPQTWTVTGSSTNDIYGIKFDGKASNAVYSFETDLAPTWGNFFATGGRNNNNKYANNVGLSSPASNDALDFIVRPGTTTHAPEPISSLLFLAGGATLGFRRFWKK